MLHTWFWYFMTMYASLVLIGYIVADSKNLAAPALLASDDEVDDLLSLLR